MKRLITIVSLIAMMSVPLSVFAGGYHWESKVKSIQGDIVASKHIAYDAGLVVILDYKTKSSAELHKELSSVFDYVDRQSFAVTNTHVTVNEFLQDNGQVVYQPIINVRYEFRMREPGNR